MIRALAAGGGGKADGLARAIAAGLPVPAGFVVEPDSDDGVLEAARRLRPPLVVRSSSVSEDGAIAGAPGVFVSRRDVGLDELLAAVHEVRASAGSPAAVAYLAHHGLGDARLFVIVQEQIAGTLGTLYTRTPDDPASPVMLIESPDGVRLASRDAADPLVALGLAAEVAIGAAADVEWVRGDDGSCWLVQARPIRFAPQAPDEILLAARALDPAKVWTWDAAHNPEPLSPAQAGLVALVADLGGTEPAVLAGYLYTTPRPREVPLIAPEALRAAFDHDLLPAWRARLAAARGEGLSSALDAYRDVYAAYTGTWGASLAAARRAHAAALAQVGAAPPAGHFPEAWDVLFPSQPPVAAPARRARTLVEDLAALAEEDDAIFAEAQDLVRMALKELGARHGLSLEDVCHLPLGAVTGDVAAARRERERQAQLTPPLRILGGRALDLSLDSGWLRGVAASPGRARGVVGREVLVAKALVPGTYPRALAAKALVLEHGGILSHGAALARELGIPCVVGCRGATSLRDGERVLVDGGLGTVTRL